MRVTRIAEEKCEKIILNYYKYILLEFLMCDIVMFVYYSTSSLSDGRKIFRMGAS